MHKIIFCLCLLAHSLTAADLAGGMVFIDHNGNQVRDNGESGLAHVCVSNGREVVQTDEQGRWTLPVSEDMPFFVIKPSHYKVPVNEYQIPQHYVLHKPQGSPPLEVPGVQPTGTLPPSIDFALQEQAEDDDFEILLFGDPQARGMREVHFITRDVVQECIDTDAVLGITLGDIVADEPELFEPISASIAQIGIPWYNTFGNHDNNHDATADSLKDETFERMFGPSTTAFEYGQVAFVILNTIRFDSTGRYHPDVTEKQLQFVQNYLDLVPPEKLVVLLMHTPIITLKKREQLFGILAQREHCFSVSGHTHQLAHVFVDSGMGWNGDVPHHHFINATVSGSWWCGLLDETGIPHATMNDGAPNGYSIVSFDGNRYSIRFKAARRPADHQMNIHLPDVIPGAALDTTRVLVNVFNSSPRSVVEYKIDALPQWHELESAAVPDPHNQWMHSLSPYLDATVHGRPLDEVLGWKMDKPRANAHMWQAELSSDLATGVHTLTVRTIDMFGQKWVAHRVFHVTE